MKTRTLLAAAASLGLLALPSVAHAQTTATWQGGTNGSFVWTNNANWTGGVFPNSQDSTAIFTNVVTNTGINWTSTITLGTLSNLFAGTVVVGANSHAGDVLELKTSTDKPTIFVTNNGTIFMYANVEGTNGFTKTGGGTLAFRFNGDDLTYTGDIVLLGGTLSLEKDRSLGNVSNSILVGANSTLLSAPGANSGTVSLASTRSIVVSNNVTLSVQNNNGTTFTTINGNISGAGGVTFIGPTAGISDATSHKFTFSGTNTSTGQTTIQLGAKLTLGSTGVLNTNLSISAGNGTWAGLDLGGTTQNLTRFAPSSASTTARTIVVSNGTLNITNAAEAFVFNGTNGTVLDMSGLTAFTFNGATGNRNITIQPNIHTGAGLNTNYVYLATNGTGSNSISANTILIGNANGASAGNGNEARLILGKVNEISAQQLQIGQFNGSGVVDFGVGIVDGSLKLRGSNGVSAMTNLAVGTLNSGTRRGAGTLNLGIADALVTDTYVGNFFANATANLTQTSTITMAGGVFNGTNLYLGTSTNPALTGSSITNIAVFNQNGGTSSITLVRMGDNRASTANPIAYQSSYNLSGSGTVLRATTIDAGTNSNFGADASRTLSLSNGATLRNAAGADLSVTGFDSTAAGRMNISLAGNGAVEADASRTVTFGANTRLSGAGDLTKTGAGTLILSSGIAGANTGALKVNAGTVQLNGAGGAAAAGAITSLSVTNSATLLISASDQINNSATVTLSGGTIQRASGVSEVMGNLTVTADSVLDYVGGTAGNLQFGTYTPGAFKLTLNNFGINNTLKFGSNLSAFIDASYVGTSFSNAYFNINGMESSAFGGFRSSWDGSTFTITSVPEPSTVVAALGLTGLMLWPARRRLIALATRRA